MSENPLGPQPPHMTIEQFRAAAGDVVDLICDYWSTVQDRPVGATVQPGDVLASLPDAPPESAEPWERVLADLPGVAIDAQTHWQHPRFFGYFPCNTTFSAMLGDLLCTGLGVQGMLWQTSPAMTELELRTLDWMALALGLPERFMFQPPNAEPTGGGVIQGTASEATLVALLAALKRTRARHPDRQPVIYASSQAHSSIMKAAMIAQLAHDPGDHRHVRLLDTDTLGRADASQLEHQVREDSDAGLAPAFIVSTVGTTATGAIDPTRRMAEIAHAAGAWTHVDAAWAGAAAVCPEHRDLLGGAGLVDSVCFNPHKWLLVNFDLDCLWVADRHALTDALSITPEYLRNAVSDSGRVVDYRDWQIPLGRRFRALKLHLVMRHYGLEGMRAHVRDGIRSAEVAEGLIEGDPRFELAAPRSLSLVCFRAAARPGEGEAGCDERTLAIMRAVNASGEAFFSHANAPDGRPCIRFAVGAVLTTQGDVRQAFDACVRAAASIPVSSAG